MKPRTNVGPRSQRSKGVQNEGPNWVIIAGSALLSTLSVRLGYKLKQVLDSRQQNKTASSLKGNEKSPEGRKLGNGHLQSSTYYFAQDDDGCYNCNTGAGGLGVIKQQQCNGSEPEMVLPLVTVPAIEFNKENGGPWSSSPDRLELPQKPFHHSNSSESPCVSESGSDIYSKREVIQKLRLQLKRRDETILEMQEQIVELQGSLNSQLSHSAHLQSLLDAANRDLFDSEREIQRLRKAIADHCVGQVGSCDKSPTVPVWPAEVRYGHMNGHTNGHLEIDRNSDTSEKGRGGDGERFEMLKREKDELKEVIEGKDYLIKSYKEQTAELSIKVKELQQRLDAQLPNIL
ncbi:uncharacterized protein LOC107776508 [Nicotiana tabacum]|uniref:Intracellular protein transport protein USO1-like n=2 Tax=Nicotiana tabacum TaxID=4097 RepID=A0A1S3YIP4_TOBAC|nr:PREDICTED: uncharacterized protein LOC107776508 [Nicotiana tabacum]XP_016451904.1 PREDICTED: uncharacterized protein LOC107776508 [Nicotiana tabacum]XP_016451905.1 PREDICTED: uncharacterized protein LOC107776508 [Nicotiana tabacum]XP_016451906.1 PREDICTED: uncharacterized protein LOC107776508 [Nicotiana tabacum]XP_016451907.1 PREDICTED: uncharacterized protein LOC107776508 [Nicotiana tabacum]XP_016451908.1 PREDICTED: uncharacterized protein LOC107776508 [Nicotiana tabacum]XP_016451909.1 PR